jgi:hypothetical protein
MTWTYNEEKLKLSIISFSKLDSNALKTNPIVEVQERELSSY